MTVPVFQSSNGTTPDTEITQLKDFIVRGEPTNWCVYTSDDQAERFDDYKVASDYFDELALDIEARLVLWVRIGTMVTFRYREAAE